MGLRLATLRNKLEDAIVALDRHAKREKLDINFVGLTNKELKAHNNIDKVLDNFIEALNDKRS